jgi:hypothetical protein
MMEKKLGRYRIGDRLPDIGTAKTEIYAAFDPESTRNDHLVIIKMARNIYGPRFKDVKEKWGSSPSLMEVISCDEGNFEGKKVAYVACTYTRGEPLDKYLQEKILKYGKMPEWWPARACDMLRQLAEAIDSANRLKVVNEYKGAPHGDINMTNILVDNKKVVLIDFAEDIRVANHDYAPVEQRLYHCLKKKDLNAYKNELAPWRWDIFAFGILVHHILTLKPVFSSYDFSYANYFDPRNEQIMKDRSLTPEERVDCLLQQLKARQPYQGLVTEIGKDISELPNKSSLVNDPDCILEAIKDALDFEASSAHSVMDKVERGISTFPPKAVASQK